MDYHRFYLDLKTALPDTEIQENHPLAPYTTLKIGGPADIFIHTKSSEEFIKILKYLSKTINFSAHSDRDDFSQSPKVASTAKIKLSSDTPITILGNGSNVLISDTGLRGIVIKNTDNSIKVIDSPPIPVDFHHSYTQRHENEPEKYLDFTKLDYDESAKPQVLVKVTSGTSLPVTINQLITQGITGLQWFAYIPGTVGGATWYNIHGGAYHFADYVDSVEVFNLKTGSVDHFSKQDLNWSYEKTYFQQNRQLIILSTTLRLFKGDTVLARQVTNAWITQKVKVQPMNSAGSAFANPSLAACIPIWGEQKSTGWIIDHELGWKGKTVGSAQVSLQHSNFIVNLGNATAKDYFTLLTDIQKEVKTRFNLKLEPEVNLLGDFT